MSENTEKNLTISDNRKKVLSWLEGLMDDDWHMYHSDSEVQNIAKEAFELLKEQGEVTPIIKSETICCDGAYGEISIAYCGNCGQGIDIRAHGSYGYNYCPNCGRAVKWNDH